MPGPFSIEGLAILMGKGRSSVMRRVIGWIRSWDEAVLTVAEAFGEPPARRNVSRLEKAITAVGVVGWSGCLVESVVWPSWSSSVLAAVASLMVRGGVVAALGYVRSGDVKLRRQTKAEARETVVERAAAVVRCERGWVSAARPSKGVRGMVWDGLRRIGEACGRALGICGGSFSRLEIEGAWRVLLGAPVDRCAGEILRFVGEERAVPRDHLGQLLGMDEELVERTISRLVAGGLLACEVLVAKESAWVWLTRRGLRVSELRHLRLVNEVRLETWRGVLRSGWVSARKGGVS
jgi:hypothetical protein